MRNRYQAIASAVLIASALHAQESSGAVLPPNSRLRGTLDRYCVTCHNQTLKTAGLALDKLAGERADQGAEAWEKVIRKLAGREMPPAGMPRPDPQTYDLLRANLESVMDRAAARNPDPGPSPIHRLNRAEYGNAIRDLLALDIDSASLLPADDSAHGFDNISAVLSVTPMLMERYLSAATKISRLAIGDPAMRPVVATYSVDESFKQTARIGEDVPFGTRGGLAVRHLFPVDGEYVFEIRLQRNTTQLAFVEFSQRGKIIGLDSPHRLDLMLDGAPVKQFTVGGRMASAAEDGDLKIRIPVKAGPRTVAVTFFDEPAMPEGTLRLLKPDDPQSSALDGGPGLASLEIGGPYGQPKVGDTPSRRRIFLCKPATPREEPGCADRILTALAHRAYRRPVTDRERRMLLDFYEAGRAEGNFETGIEAALERILISPEFLFRMEADPPGATTPHRIGNIELASRLSFFLWSSIPDGELLDVAERGQLSAPGVLEQQVRRMLRDERANALVANFASQWLEFRKLQTTAPDRDTYPDFDQNLRDAFVRESELFFQSIIGEDRNVLDLLSAKDTFLNERLARHYGVPGIYGSHFRRVLLDDPNRRGLLGEGSILTATSYANRTSPVLRGKWVLENILGSPPPPPPANVPSLKEDKSTRQLTMRQRMEEHRANPACAGCHARMDPLGFALENYDGIGRWRDVTETHTAIDASGQLPDGTRFQGPEELRQILLSHSQQFITTLTEKLLTYALGRELEYYDAPAVRKIVHDAAAADNRWSAIVLGIVESAPFQMRRPTSQ